MTLPSTQLLAFGFSPGAAFEGHLDQIPSESLNSERMLTRNYDGLTVEELARDRGHYDQIPLAARPRTISPIRRFFRNLGRSRAPF